MGLTPRREENGGGRLLWTPVHRGQGRKATGNKEENNTDEKCIATLGGGGNIAKSKKISRRPPGFSILPFRKSSLYLLNLVYNEVVIIFFLIISRKNPAFWAFALASGKRASRNRYSLKTASISGEKGEDLGICPRGGRRIEGVEAQDVLGIYRSWGRSWRVSVQVWKEPSSWRSKNRTPGFPSL